jgi:serine phosphatase RsbU (regulator of sigma subunit)
VGDVSGKGIPAALASSGVSHLLPWLRPLQDPAGALSDLNQDLLDRLPAESYATLILAEIDGTREAALHVWSAGHPPALLWRAKEQKAEILTASSFPLGMFPDWQTEPLEVSWGNGDILLLYTDGLTETRDEHGTLFGASRVREALAASASGNAADIVRSLQGAIEAWGVPADDMTIVALKRTGGE